MIIIPAITPRDFDHAKSLLAELLAFEKSLRPVRKDIAHTIDGAFRYVRENIVAHNGAIFLALDENENAVAMISGWIGDGDGLDARSNRIGMIVDCYVQPGYRGTGIFKKLVAALSAHFVAHGITTISVDTLGANKTMQTVLEKSGFTAHKVIYEIDLDRTL